MQFGFYCVTKRGCPIIGTLYVLCILSGKIVNEINLKFIYSAKEKSLSKKHISIVEIEFEIERKQIIKLYAYDEMADFVYRNLKKDDYILIEGKIRDKFVETYYILHDLYKKAQSPKGSKVGKFFSYKNLSICSKNINQ